MPHTLWLDLLAQLQPAARTPLPENGWSMPGVNRIGALAAGLALGVLSIWYFARFRKPRPKEHAPQSPQQLFRELCRAHNLTAAQERLLEWVISDRQLSQPGLLFLDPLLLERAISRSDAPGVRRRLTDLRSKLFAGHVGMVGGLS
jgi:hypothetical protein